jgi:hypothetical protein
MLEHGRAVMRQMLIEVDGVLGPAEQLVELPLAVQQRCAGRRPDARSSRKRTVPHRGRGGGCAGPRSRLGLYWLHYLGKAGTVACRTFMLLRFSGWLFHMDSLGHPSRRGCFLVLV